MNPNSIKAENHAYPLVDLLSIKVVERPPEGDLKQIFYNPRSLESFTPNEMNDLKQSIIKDGLQQPLIVRILTEDKSKTGAIKAIELIAGERRYRTIRSLYQSNIQCYSPDQDTQVSAQELYNKVPCKVYYNISDEKALSLAWTENQKRKDLSIKEEIVVIERLVLSGKSVKEVADLLNTNITMVSQFSNFRKELPKEAFEKLVTGKLAKHVAVKLLSYNPEDRQKLFDAALEAEAEDTEQLADDLSFELEELEDAVDMQEELDPTANKKSVLEKKIEVVKTKLDKTLNEKGVIKQGALIKGAKKISVKPKKGNLATEDLDTHQFYVKLTTSWLKNGKIDPLTKQQVPPDVLEIIAETAKSILASEGNPMNIVHRVMVARGKWEMHDEMVLDSPHLDVAPERTTEQVFEEED